MHDNVMTVLVADATHAQLFEGNAHDGFTLRESISPEDTGHAASPHADPKDVVSDKFAHQLSKQLTARLDAHKHPSLVLVAPAHFLGVLQKTLGDQVEKHVTRTVSKDLLSLSPTELVDRLKTELGASES